MKHKYNCHANCYNHKTYDNYTALFNNNDKNFEKCITVISWRADQAYSFLSALVVSDKVRNLMLCLCRRSIRPVSQNAAPGVRTPPLKWTQNMEASETRTVIAEEEKEEK